MNLKENPNVQSEMNDNDGRSSVEQTKIRRLGAKIATTSLEVR